ncbi:MAG: hypothetical protein WA547_04150 [Thermoplasmata archaeon]
MAPAAPGAPPAPPPPGPSAPPSSAGLKAIRTTNRIYFIGGGAAAAAVVVIVIVVVFVTGVGGNHVATPVSGPAYPLSLTSYFAFTGCENDSVPTLSPPQWEWTVNLAVYFHPTDVANVTFGDIDLSDSGPTSNLAQSVNAYDTVSFTGGSPPVVATWETLQAHGGAWTFGSAVQASLLSPLNNSYYFDVFGQGNFQGTTITATGTGLHFTGSTSQVLAQYC